MKFVVVGAIGTIINLLVLYILTDKLGVYYLLSAIISFLIAMTSNFILNKIWTFEERFRTKVNTRYLKFATVSLMALAVNLLFLYFFTEIIGMYYLFSQVLAIALALVINFIGNKLWTFKK